MLRNVQETVMCNFVQEERLRGASGFSGGSYMQACKSVGLFV